MSALIISHDLHIMMLELSVEKLYVPRTSVFDSALMKKTTVMFRMLDDEWTALYPHRSDYRRYRGSNYESEPFHGGKSVVFSIPEASLQKKMENVDLQMHISKDVSRYFEMHPSQNIGFVIVKVDNLFNGIIKELKLRKELAPYLHVHEREPIARSMKGTFSILNDNSEETESKIDLYIRISYFGKSIITEIVTPETIEKAFYAQEETNEMHPYQCRELKPEELEGGCWGSVTILPPVKSKNLKCDCKNEKTKELLEMQLKDRSGKENVPTMGADSFDRRKDDDRAKDKGKKKEKGKGKGKGKDKSKVSDEDKDDRIRNGNTGMSDSSADEKDGKGKKRNEDEKVKDLGFIDDKKDKSAKRKREEDGEGGGEKKKGKGKKGNEDENVNDLRFIDDKKDKSAKEKKGKEKNENEDEKMKEGTGKAGKENRKEREGKEDGKNQRAIDKGRGTKDKGENEDKQKDKGKQKSEAVSIDFEKIRRLKRRNAGPCTIGISEKKPRLCVPDPFTCKICFSDPKLTPCPLKPCQIPCFPLNCLQTHFCQEPSIFCQETC